MTIHIVEAGGSGGVHQHALRIAMILGDGASPVLVHTAEDGRDPTPPGVSFCYCHKWFRGTAAPLRPTLIAAWYLFRVVPHAVRLRGGIWIQGQFKLPLTLTLIAILRIFNRRVAFSPHNSFSREGGRAAGAILKACFFLSDYVIAYNNDDFATLKNVIRLPLVMLVPAAETREDLTSALAAMPYPRVGLLGQIRPDKNFDFALRVVAALGGSAILAGEDKGDAERITRLADDLKVPTYRQIEYLELTELAALIRSSDLILCPYSQGSQSGVANMARQVAVPTILSGLSATMEPSRYDYSMDDLHLESWVQTAQAALEEVAQRDSVGVSDESVTLERYERFACQLRGF